MASFRLDGPLPRPARLYPLDNLFDLDEWLDADYLFVLIGVPNFRVSPTQQEFLNQAISCTQLARTENGAIRFPRILPTGAEVS